MSIKFKLALPILAGLLLILLLIEYFWLPFQLEKAKNAFEKQTHELLVLGSSGIIQDLLENDLGSLFSNIEQLEKSYKDRWFNLSLYRENKKRIYPIFIINSEVSDQVERFIHISYPLRIGETSLGYLDLDIDWVREKNKIIKDIRNIRDIIVLVIILVLLVTTISQYRIIYRPLKKLSVAANKIKRGSFNTELPVYSNDEIGELISSFTEMQTELSFQKKALDHHALVSIADKDGLIIHVNNRFAAVSGYPREELIGKTHRIIKSDTHSPEFYKDIWRTITSGNVWHGEICNLKKSGEKYWVSSTIVPYLDKKGVPKRYISIRTDITKQKNAEEQLRYMANHDALTNLPTRRLAKENLSMALSIARRDQKMVAVMFIDLDGFKVVNDTLGHDAGDLLLVSVSERLGKCAREMDTVARVGGDEFIVILSRIDNRDNAGLVAQKIIDSLAMPFNLNNKTASIGASIGIALYPGHVHDPEELIKCADEMMYAVKRRGKNSFAFYDDK